MPEIVLFYMLRNQGFSIPDNIDSVFKNYPQIYNSKAEELLKRNHIDKDGYSLIKKESEKFKGQTIQSRVEQALIDKLEDARYEAITGVRPDTQDHNASKFAELEKYHRLACQRAKDIASLTSRMLCVNPSGRPSAREVSEELKSIFSIPLLLTQKMPLYNPFQRSLINPIIIICLFCSC